MNKNKAKQSFDPETSFFDLPIVRRTAYINFVLSLGSYIIITWQSGLWLRMDWSYNGFNFWMECYRFPLATLAMLIPIGAVYAANHRSEQTKKQIVLTNKQNLFSNYYKHIEEFEKYIEKRLETVLDHKAFENLNHVKTTAFDIRQYHRTLFPDLLHTGDTKVDREFLSKLEKHFDISMLLKAEQIDSLEKANDLFLKLIKDLKPILTKYHLSLGDFMVQGVTLKEISISNYRKTQLRLLNQREDKNVTAKCHCYSIIDSIERIHAILKIIDTCARFDTYYETMKCLQTVERLQRTITKGSISRLKCIAKGEIEQVLKVELFQDDEIPNEASYKAPEDKVCAHTLEYSIMYSIEDSISQYAQSTHDSQTSLVIA